MIRSVLFYNQEKSHRLSNILSVVATATAVRNAAIVEKRRRSIHCRFVSSSSSSSSLPPSILEDYETLSQIPLHDVRNFCFIAHIDHGKSSLSSRVLELTGNLGREAQQLAWEHAAMQQERISEDDKNASETANLNNINNKKKKAFSAAEIANDKERIEALDSLSVEQQRGITVKASAASMLYRHASAVGPTGTLLLNMYDTPGHVDFGLEVTRSLWFVQGAVLLLDSTQGIQAQTWSVYEKVKAMKPNDPKLLIALTKVDLESARPIHCALTLSEWLDWKDPDEIIQTSARTRIGIKPLLDAVCEQVPPPQPMNISHGDSAPLVAQVVDSWYDSRGVNCLIRVVSGKIAENDRISIVLPSSSSSNTAMPEDSVKTDNASYSLQEAGLVLPHTFRTGTLSAGQMGYVRFGLRDPRQAMPGTILLHTKNMAQVAMLELPRLPKNMLTKSVLYASVHPQEADGFEDLVNAVERLALNDTGLEVAKTAAHGSGEGGGPFLGPGLRVGFQGLLHVEVFRQRLLDEHGIEAIVTPPKVPYRLTIVSRDKNKEPEVKIIEDLSEWPDSSKMAGGTNGNKITVEEPIVLVRIVARVEDAGAVMELVTRKRGFDLETKPMDEEKWVFMAKIPWGEVVVDFHDQLKNITAGYGSMDTFDAGYAPANLSKVDIYLNDDIVEPLAFVCHKDAAYNEARTVCHKLQEVLPRQQFVTVVQAKVDSKVIAAERIKAFRKDVLMKSGKVVGGGDQTRKMKLLKKQKEGKKRMQQSGTVRLSQAAFNSVITRNS